MAAFALVAVVLAGAAPASAHEEISPVTIAVGAPTFFTLSAANEEKVDLVAVTVTAPPGVPFGATTKTPSGWNLVSAEDTAVTWTAAGGQGTPPGTFETWGFETDGADQPGTATYRVALTFGDGKTNTVDVPVTVTVTPTSGLTSKAAETRQKKDHTAAAALVLAVLALGVGFVALGVAATRRHAPHGGADTPAESDW